MVLEGEKKRAYARAWIAARRSAFFKDKVCAWCGRAERLELDHIDPSTKVSHRIWSWSEQRRLEEISKCQVLCHDCHAAKTKFGQDNFGAGEANHGTKTTNAQVLRLRELYGTGMYSYRELGEMFDLPKSTVAGMVRGTDRWKDLPVASHS